MSGIVGFGLIAAAATKLFAKSGSVELSGGGEYTPPLQFLAVQIELLLGAWLILGRMPVTAWLSACLLLVTLSALSLNSALRGQSDCGCFGDFKLHPGITATVNLLTLGLLVVFRPRVNWSANRSTLLAVASLALVAVVSVLIANGPLGDKLLAKWQGRTVALQSSVVGAGEEPLDTLKRLTVTVINSSSRDVRIIGGSVSCSCTTTQNLPLMVPADGEALVEIEIKFRGTPGQFEHKFELLTDDKKQPKLHGVIVGRVADTPP